MNWFKRNRLWILGYLILQALILLSLGISFVVFVPVNNVPDTFLTSLITVDSLSIAVVGFVFPIAVRTLKVEQGLKKLERSLESLSPPDDIKTDKEKLRIWIVTAVVPRLLSFGLATSLLIAPVLFIALFAVSIFFGLGALLRTGNDQGKWALLGFSATVFGYLLLLTGGLFLVWVLWKIKVANEFEEVSRSASEHLS
jgi:hypothetical protein